MKNIKDTITTVCGIIMAVAASISGLDIALTQAGYKDFLPSWVLPTSIVILGITGAINGFFIGKKSTGKTKNDNELT